MLSGKVKFFDITRGFGFITDATGKDFFFHYSYIWHQEQVVKPGDAVGYDLVPADNPDKGPTARHIRVEGREVVERDEAPPMNYRTAQDRPPETQRTAETTPLVAFMGQALTGLLVDWDAVDGVSPDQIADTAYLMARAALDRLNRGQA